MKRGSTAIDRRQQQKNVSKRMRLDLEEAAAKAGLSVDELHSLAAAEPAEEDDEDGAEDIACMVCQLEGRCLEVSCCGGMGGCLGLCVHIEGLWCSDQHCEQYCCRLTIWF